VHSQSRGKTLIQLNFHFLPLSITQLSGFLSSPLPPLTLAHSLFTIPFLFLPVPLLCCCVYTFFCALVLLFASTVCRNADFVLLPAPLPFPPHFNSIVLFLPPPSLDVPKLCTSAIVPLPPHNGRSSSRKYFLLTSLTKGT
jgi:hypothetical protein